MTVCYSPLSLFPFQCMQVFLVVQVRAQEYDLGDGHYNNTFSEEPFGKERTGRETCMGFDFGLRESLRVLASTTPAC